MKFENEQGLVDDLERGIGEVHWNAFAWDASLRLRLPLCGMTSLALTEALRNEGFEAESVESTTNLSTEEGMEHVFTVVNAEEGRYIIDPTYSQFLDTIGLGTGYVTFGGEDLFPSRKIAVVPFEEGDVIAKQLADATQHFRIHRQPVQDHLLAMSRYSMDDFTYDEVEREYSKIWNPDNFEPFIPRDGDTVKAGHRLAQFILPEHVKMIA